MFLIIVGCVDNCQADILDTLFRRGDGVAVVVKCCETCLPCCRVVGIGGNLVAGSKGRGDIGTCEINRDRIPSGAHPIGDEGCIGRDEGKS